MLYLLSCISTTMAPVRRRIERRDAKSTAPIVIILILVALVIFAWLLQIEKKRRRRKREYEEWQKSLPRLRQPNVATAIDVGNAHGQSPIDYINERYFGRDNHFSSAQRQFDDLDDDTDVNRPPGYTPPRQPPAVARTPTTPHIAPPSYTASNTANTADRAANLPPPPSYN